MESKLVLHTKTRHINVYARPENVTHLTKENMGTLNLQGGTVAYVKQFIDEHNQDESAHTYIQENLSTLEGTVTEHIEDNNNPHAVTKEQLGLGNVDNTSDADKPISTATQAALDAKADESDLTAHTTNTSNPHNVTKAQVGLGNVDNTSDLNKPISTATQAALDGKQATISDLETIRSGAALGATSVQPGDLATVATTGDYYDLTNNPTIGNATLTIQKNGTSAGTFTANATSNKTINITVPTTAADVDALPDTTKYGASLDLNINSSTYVVTAQLKDQDGNALGTAQTIDLPLESVVVSGSYDSANKKVVLTLQSGSTIEFSVADLVAGLQSEITSSNKLSADLVDDTNTAHKFVTASDKSTWNGKQDAISDLATIRSGAAAGATALQPSEAASTYSTKAETVTSVVAGSTADKLDVTKNGATSTITVNNVAKATRASEIDTTEASTNTNRPVFFGFHNNNNKLTYNNAFQYNPATNVLTVGSITGNAASATNATSATKATQDGNGNNIVNTYIPKNFGGKAPSVSGPTASEVYGSSSQPKGCFKNMNILHTMKNYFYRADKNLFNTGTVTVTCSYDDVVSGLGVSMLNGNFSGYRPSINPSTMFQEKPFVWTILSSNSFETSDVCHLFITGHRLAGTGGFTKYKLEVAADYDSGNPTWYTLIDYDGAAVDFGQKHFSLYSSEISTSPAYHSVRGVRLTISGSTSTVLQISQIMLLASRGTENPSDGLHALDVGKGGKVVGDITIPSQYGSFIGNLTGTASKATADANGNTISSTYIKYTSNSKVNVVGNTKTVAKTSPETLYVPNGLIMGGTAAAAGLVTRGICGSNSPTATGAATKENLYINYDGTNTYNSGRQLVIQAGTVGTHYGNNLYQFCAARGDAVKNFCDNTYAKKTDIMTGATSSTAGASGLVPAPAAGDEAKFLRGDGTWVGSTTAAVWGSLTGTLSDQTDLQNALNAKQGTLSTAQLNAANSGITSTKVGNYDTHIADNDIHVTAAQKTMWSGKQDALSSAQQNAANSGITAAKVSGYDTHVANGDIHVTAAQKTAWTGKQDAISDLATIRSGASAGATAVQPADLQTAINSVKRNIGEIVPSMIPLTDAGLHLLDGSLIQGGGIYQGFVDYIAGLYDNTSVSGYKLNVNVTGSVINNNGVLSNFSTSNYAKFPSNFQPNSNPWEIVFKVTTGNDVTTTQYLCSFQKGSTNETRYATRIGLISSRLTISVTYNGTAWDIVESTSGATGSYTILPNTTYYLKYQYTGNAYILSYSLDGKNYTQDCYVASTTPMYNSCTYCVIGLWNNGSTLDPWLGSIDLNESYININGQRWWTGAEAIKPCFCTEANWQTSVTTYGVCGKFVYDSANNTVRLPKVTGIVEGTTDINALGNLVEAGLPNITGNITPSVLFSDEWIGNGVFQTSAGSNTEWTALNSMPRTRPIINFDASRSNSIYGNSNTVQPQTIKCFVYIVIANSTKTDIQVDIDEIATDLNGKADTDLSNVPSSKGILVETYSNGTSGYRIYSDGYCEQWGQINPNQSVGGGGYNVASVTFLKPFANTYYVVNTNSFHDRFNTGSNSKSTDSMSVYYVNDSSNTFTITSVGWFACGYIS